MTPLVLSDQRVVLVNRGWTPGGPTRDTLPRVSVPAMPVRVEGRIGLPPSRYLELGAGVTEAVWQNLDPQRFAQLTGVPVLPIVIEQTHPLDAADALVRDWPAPDLGSEPHRIYMFQWYAFASLAAGLWILFHAPAQAMKQRPPAAAPYATVVRKNRRTLLLIGLVTLAPVIASYVAYYWFPRDRQVNYGELLPTAPVPELRGALPNGEPFKLVDLQGKWVLAVAAAGGCDASCAQALYAMREARTIQGREMDRVVRVLLVTDDAPVDASVLAEHPDLLTARVVPADLARWPSRAERIVLVDPLGNLVLAYPRNPDIKALAKDLTRLLKASRIG